MPTNTVDLRFVQARFRLAILRPVPFVLALVIGIAACTDENFQEPGVRRAPDLSAGTVYQAAATFAAPRVERLPIPPQFDGVSVWGATGRDDAGHVYFGLSADSGPHNSGVLLKYSPEEQVVLGEGTVAENLARQKPALSSGALQAKIHSKIYEADDGYLYFASMDEAGETDTINPKWGGHLWRKRPERSEWDHVLSAPQALIALNTDGRYVYALGYWDHVLYQFDTHTEIVRQTTVGSVPGHVTRNFLVDDEGHAYVPRVSLDASGAVSATLCEFDTQLVLVSCLPLSNYFPRDRDPRKAHGIVAYTRMRNGSIAFISGADTLQVLTPGYASPHETHLKNYGPMHPEGESLVKSLFTFEGVSMVAAVGNSPTKKGELDWIIFELSSGVASAEALDLEHLALRKSPALYGSATKDNEGAFYVVGRVAKTRGHDSEPIILRLYH